MHHKVYAGHPISSLQVPPKSGNIRQFLFESFPPDFHAFESEFYFYNCLLDLLQTVIEDQNQDPEDILNFLPIPLTLPGKMSFSREVEEPLVLLLGTECGKMS